MRFCRSPSPQYVIKGILLLSILLLSTSNAQITVSASQFYSVLAPGQTTYFRHLDPSFTTVNIGKMGGPNIYDYTLAKLLPPERSNNFSISGIPVLAARYPIAASTFGTAKDSIEKNPVFLLSADTVFVLGEASLVPQYRFKHNRPFQPFLFPATYQRAYARSGNVYDTTYNSTGGIAALNSYAYNDSLIVDGYGTLKIPGRQFECLRVELLHTLYGDKEIMFFTREGVFGDIWVDAAQPDTGVVKVSNLTIIIPPAFVGVDRESSLPGEFNLMQNFPNPFNPTTTIQFTLPERSHIRLTVLDLLGRELATVADGELGAGTHTSVFDGSRFSSGMYFYRLQSGSSVQTKKLVLIK